MWPCGLTSGQKLTNTKSTRRAGFRSAQKSPPTNLWAPHSKKYFGGSEHFHVTLSIAAVQSNIMKRCKIIAANPLFHNQNATKHVEINIVIFFSDTHETALLNSRKYGKKRSKCQGRRICIEQIKVVN